MPWVFSFALLTLAVAMLFALSDLNRRLARRRLYSLLKLHHGFDEPSPKSEEDASGEVPELRSCTCHITRPDGHVRLDIFENLEHDVEPGDPTETQTTLMITLNDVVTPRFMVEPKSVPRGVQMKIENEEELAISGEEAFSEFNLVTAAEREAVRRLLRTANVSALLHMNRYLTVESRGHHLLFYHAETLLDKKRILEVADLACTFANRLRQAALKPNHNPDIRPAAPPRSSYP